MKKLFIGLLLFSHYALASTASPIGDWNVTTKSCNATPKPVSSPEVIYLRDSFLGHSYVESEDQEKKCIQVQAMGRVIQNYRDYPDRYYEESILIAKVLRTICKNKSTGEIISDSTVPFNKPEESIKITLYESQGNIDISDSSFCPSGILHIEIQKKQQVVLQNTEIENEPPVKIDL